VDRHASDVGAEGGDARPRRGADVAAGVGASGVPEREDVFESPGSSGLTHADIGI